MKRLIWQCEKCEDVVVSYSHLRHQMDFCECGESAVDLEEHYSRYVGIVKNISLKVKSDGQWKKP